MISQHCMGISQDTTVVKCLLTNFEKSLQLSSCIEWIGGQSKAWNFDIQCWQSFSHQWGHNKLLTYAIDNYFRKAMVGMLLPMVNINCKMWNIMALHKNDYKCCQLIVSIEFLILCKHKKAQFIEIYITHTFISLFFLHYIKAQVWWKHFCHHN